MAVTSADLGVLLQLAVNLQTVVVQTMQAQGEVTKLLQDVISQLVPQPPAPAAR